jgi:hypothetical protein
MASSGPSIIPAGRTIRASFTDLQVISLTTTAEAFTPNLAVPVMRSKIREPLLNAELCGPGVQVIGTVGFETSELELIGSTGSDMTLALITTS